jgi:serine/threonine protein kinase
VALLLLPLLLLPLLLLLQPHEQARMTTTMGTPAFMAPEMCGLRSTPFAPFPAEVWAVGVCLYMFVFGKGEVQRLLCRWFACLAVNSLLKCMQFWHQCLHSTHPTPEKLVSRVMTHGVT